MLFTFLIRGRTKFYLIIPKAMYKIISVIAFLVICLHFQSCEKNKHHDDMMVEIAPQDIRQYRNSSPTDETLPPGFCMGFIRSPDNGCDTTQIIVPCGGCGENQYIKCLECNCDKYKKIDELVVAHFVDGGVGGIGRIGSWDADWNGEIEDCISTYTNELIIIAHLSIKVPCDLVSEQVPLPDLASICRLTKTEMFFKIFNDGELITPIDIEYHSIYRSEMVKNEMALNCSDFREECVGDNGEIIKCKARVVVNVTIPITPSSNIDMVFGVDEKKHDKHIHKNKDGQNPHDMPTETKLPCETDFPKYSLEYYECIESYASTGRHEPDHFKILSFAICPE